MKKVKVITFIVVFMMSFAGESTAHCHLDYPVGGETFNAGDMVTIKWSIVIYHGASNWDLSFSSDNGVTWMPIESNISETILSYVWTVPNISSNSCRVKVVQDNNSNPDYDSKCEKFTITGATDVNETQIHANDFILYFAYPNPFNPTTRISYSLPELSSVSIRIYDMLGNEVTTLVDATKPEGRYNLELNASGWTSGVYFYKLEAVPVNANSRKTFIQTKKIILLR